MARWDNVFHYLSDNCKLSQIVYFLNGLFLKLLLLSKIVGSTSGVFFDQDKMKTIWAMSDFGLKIRFKWDLNKKVHHSERNFK